MQKSILLPIFLIIFITSACTKISDNYVTVDGFAQGSTYHIVYQLPSNNNPDSTIAAIKDSIGEYFIRINKSVSGYDSTSILSQINGGENPPLDKIFIDVFNYAKYIHMESNGAVDASAAPLFNMWGFGFKNGVEVTQKNIDSLKNFIGMEKLSVEKGENGEQWFLHRENPQITLNFNAIAQGYTVDYFSCRFRDMGIDNYLIEIGGEVYCQGVNSAGKEWKVGIDRPADGNYIQGESVQAIIQLSNRALVTSGNYRKFYMKDGVKYSHTIDPVSGYPVQHSLLSATVVADDATTADAYATYFMVIGLEKAKEVLAATPGMEALLIYGAQDNMKEYRTEGMKELTNRI